jgi:hypothetical protein
MGLGIEGANLSVVVVRVHRDGIEGWVIGSGTRLAIW